MKFYLLKDVDHLQLFSWQVWLLQVFDGELLRHPPRMESNQCRHIDHLVSIIHHSCRHQDSPSMLSHHRTIPPCHLLSQSVDIGPGYPPEAADQ